MKYPGYNLEQILTDNNLIFDLKLDVSFKNIFNENNKKYLCYLISCTLNYDYNDLIKKLIFINKEIPNNISNKSSYCDLVLQYRNKIIIIEMNNGIDKYYAMNKNYFYLFKQHTSRLNNKNKYGINLQSILINIDNFDILGKKKFLYSSEMIFDRYNLKLYKKIKVIHINLECLKEKYYNNIEITELEKRFLIFIEQRKDRLKNIIKREELEELMLNIERLKFEEHNGIVTYDREEYEKMIQEERERKYKRYKKNMKKLKELEQNIKANLENMKTKEENIKTKEENIKTKEENIKRVQDLCNIEKIKLENDKIDFARQLKKIGTPVDKIIEITKLSLEQIKSI